MSRIWQVFYHRNLLKRADKVLNQLVKDFELLSTTPNWGRDGAVYPCYLSSTRTHQGLGSQTYLGKKLWITIPRTKFSGDGGQQRTVLHAQCSATMVVSVHTDCLQGQYVQNQYQWQVSRTSSSTGSSEPVLLANIHTNICSPGGFHNGGI